MPRRRKLAGKWMSAVKLLPSTFSASLKISGTEAAQTAAWIKPALAMPRTFPSNSWRVDTDESKISIRRFSFFPAEALQHIRGGKNHGQSEQNRKDGEKNEITQPALVGRDLPSLVEQVW